VKRSLSDDDVSLFVCLSVANRAETCQKIWILKIQDGRRICTETLRMQMLQSIASDEDLLSRHIGVMHLLYDYKWYFMLVYLYSWCALIHNQNVSFLFIFHHLPVLVSVATRTIVNAVPTMYSICSYSRGEMKCSDQTAIDSYNQLLHQSLHAKRDVVLFVPFSSINQTRMSSVLSTTAAKDYMSHSQEFTKLFRQN